VASHNQTPKILKSDQRETKFFSQTLVESVLIYGAETWTLTKQLERSLDGCYTRLLRAALNISWKQKVPINNYNGDLPKLSMKVRSTHYEPLAHTTIIRRKLPTNSSCGI
jgi:hypothetical protein